METSAGEPLISTRPSAVTKWSAWLVSKESPPRLSGSKHSYTESCCNILPHPCRCLLTGSTQKTLKSTKTLCSQYCWETTQTCRNAACIWSSGECNGWPVSRHEPLDTTKLVTIFPVFFCLLMKHALSLGGDTTCCVLVGNAGPAPIRVPSLHFLHIVLHLVIR